PYFRHLKDVCNWDAALKILSPSLESTSLQLAQQMAMMPAQPCLQDRLYSTWAQMLVLASQPQQPPVDPNTGMPQMDPQTGQPVEPGPPLYEPPQEPEAQQALQQVLQWRAHKEAHKLGEQQAQMKAMRTPTPAQPGAEATPAGNEVTPGAPPAQ